MTIPESHTERHDTRRALGIMALSAAMFGLMAFTAKTASARLSGAEVSMIRFAIGILPALLIPAYRRSAMHFARWDLLFYRGFFGGLAVLAYFTAIQHTTVGVATLLNYTAPVFSGLFSLLFIGERFSAKILLPLTVAFAGIILVVRAHGGPHDVLGFGKWELVGLSSAVLSGVALTAMRAARRTESSWSVYASFCLIGLLTNAPFGLWHWQTPTVHEWASLILTGLFAILAQIAMTHSLRWIDAMTVGVISQLAVVISMILGALFLSEPITSRAAFGSVLTMAGVIGVMMVTSARKPSAEVMAPEL